MTRILRGRALAGSATACNNNRRVPRWFVSVLVVEVDADGDEHDQDRGDDPVDD
jgi:hypothetical protein